MKTMTGKKFLNSPKALLELLICIVVLGGFVGAIVITFVEPENKAKKLETFERDLGTLDAILAIKSNP